MSGIQIMQLGLNYDGKPIGDTMSEADFGGRLGRIIRDRGLSLPASSVTLRDWARTRGEVSRQPLADLGDPREAGWTFLVHADDPDRERIVEIIRPLAHHRGMLEPDRPLLYANESRDELFSWFDRNYTPREYERVPHYILIVGGPDRIPFYLQAVLDSPASVGRVAFDDLGDLKTYVAKLLRLEQAKEPTVERKVIVYGSDDGPTNATHFSAQYLATPLADHIEQKHQLRVDRVIGPDATKSKLAAALRNGSPALVFTASHGMEARDEDMATKTRYNGAICCTHEPAASRDTWVFSESDVPTDIAFLEGSVFFQFACFGYGTPAESDFAHWIGQPSYNADYDFVAALPKKLLAHPRGPIGFIGHVDSAWLHGFMDRAAFDLTQRWDARVAPFRSAMDELLSVRPAGYSMTEMNRRYDIANAYLTDAVDRAHRYSAGDDGLHALELARSFIYRSDAQNYMVFGDPAARLRIPAGS